MEQTLAIIKPDAFSQRLAGKIIDLILEAGLRIAAVKVVHLTRRQAEGFYHVHAGKFFFGGLVDFMTEGPVMVMVLESDNAITRWRELMGVTDPAKADAGTIRRRFGSSVERNAAHGSDHPETAAFEIHYFFNDLEIVRANP